MQSYSELVADAKSFLDGKSSGVQAKLAKEMEGAAKRSISNVPPCCATG